MNTLKTNNDFSKKSRNKLNQLFAELRRLVEPQFSNVSDWNRFRIIDGAIALLTNMPLKQSNSRTDHPEQLSNKEACAFYRNKLNQCFHALKTSLFSLGITEKTRSRPALLKTTIVTLSSKTLLRTLPRPIIRVAKRPLEEDDSYRYSPDEKQPRSIGSTPSPHSSFSDQSTPANVLINHRLFLEHFKLAQPFPQISSRAPEKVDDFWRPW
jgi:hypothetical protein